MIKISTSDAFVEAVRKMDEGDFQRAQEILNLLSYTIKEEKRIGQVSQYITLKTHHEERLFQHICIEGKAKN